VPARETIQNHRDDRRDVEQRIHACRARIRSAEQDLTRHRKARDRLTHDEDAVAPKAVADARELRDSGWSLIRRRYVEGVPVPDDEIRAFTGAETDLANTYETKVAVADTLADRPFDNAQVGPGTPLFESSAVNREELLLAALGESKLHPQAFDVPESLLFGLSAEISIAVEKGISEVPDR
jgi:hypothetical protein